MSALWSPISVQDPSIPLQMPGTDYLWVATAKAAAPDRRVGREHQSSLTLDADQAQIGAPQPRWRQRPGSSGRKNGVIYAVACRSARRRSMSKLLLALVLARSRRTRSLTTRRNGRRRAAVLGGAFRSSTVAAGRARRTASPRASSHRGDRAAAIRAGRDDGRGGAPRSSSTSSARGAPLPGPAREAAARRGAAERPGLLEKALDARSRRHSPWPGRRSRSPRSTAVWRVEPRLEGDSRACGRPEYFTIRP